MITAASDELKDLGYPIDEPLSRLEAFFDAQRHFASRPATCPLSTDS